MPFQAILKDLVSSVEGAEGAIFLDGEGEAVQWYAKDNGDRLRLRAAYIAVAVQACRAISTGLKLGAMRHLTIEYERARLLIQEIESDYFIVIELNTSANLGQAFYRIQPTLERIRRLLAA